jgi:hypothetical protein
MISPDLLRAQRTEARELFELSRLKRPTIKILLYTDAPTQIVRESVGRFGLGRMIQQLEAHAPAFANLSIKWAGRYSPGSRTADQKVNVVMENEFTETKQPFDEIWFFGAHQINKERFDLRVGGGGSQESELDEVEVDELKKWMDHGGGVLVTGDHANARPLDAIDRDSNPRCPDKIRQAKFLGLGRALGRCIPRGGLMRDWEGPPTSREQDSNNTQIITSGAFDDFDDQIFFQRDRVPQQLILTTCDELGRPAIGGQVHPLFFYRPGHQIQLFPDHLHEGEVTVSRGRHDEVWPTKPFKPMPRVVAFGTDKRSGKRIKILAAYDGDGANVGRIVADSSWHHYFNINLALFEQPAPLDSASDQIGQFYSNLALWLCPARKRLEMAAVMAESLARDAPITEVLGPVPNNDKTNKQRAGALAHRLLSSLASQCEIHELLNMTIPPLQRYFVSSATISLPDGRSTHHFLPSKESLLANIVNQYPPELLEQNESNFSEAASKRIGKAFARAWDEACAEQRWESERSAELTANFFDETERRVSALSDENSPR